MLTEVFRVKGQYSQNFLSSYTIILRITYILILIFKFLLKIFQTYIKTYFCLIDYAKAFDCVDHNKLWKILKDMGIPDHLTCLLRSLYTGQEATVRSGHGATDWFQIGKGVRQDCILSLCLFNLYAEYIMRNAGLDEAQAKMQMIPPLWQKVKKN